MRNNRLTIAILLILISFNCFSASESSFPKEWQSWVSVSTPLTGIGALPDCDANVEALPPIYQETVEIYCGIRPQGPGAVEVLIKRSEVTSFNLKNGKLNDGPAMILHLKDMGVLLVTSYKSNVAQYGIFKEDGTDISSTDAGSPLNPETCRTCHTGYASFCTNGQCATAVK